MAGEFNPYHVWLGIPPEEQPANLYRLLGIPLFEDNADVIDNAADRQSTHLRTFQGGKHGEQTQRLLNEVAAARVCLLDVKKRTTYDQLLRGKLPAGASNAPGPNQYPQAINVRAIPRAIAIEQKADNRDDRLDSTPPPRPGAGGTSAVLRRPKAALQTAKGRKISFAIVLGIGLLAVAGFGMHALSGSSEGIIEFDWPDRADLAVTVDDQPIPVPYAGPWERKFPAGPHRIVARRPAFKLTTSVDLSAGERVRVSPDWRPKAVLVFDWPLADRGWASMKLDGREQPMRPEQPLELPVEPGQHQIEIAAQGAAPYSTIVTIAADQRAIVAVARPSEKESPGIDSPLAKPLDLLAPLKLDEGIIRGTWVRHDDEISSEISDASAMELPVTIEGGYDLDVDFTRTQGTNDIHVIFPVGDHECNAVFSAYEGGVSGLYLLDGLGVERSPVSVRPGTIENGQRYHLSISVRLPQENVATIGVMLDTKPVWPEWQGDPARWTTGGSWTPSATHRIAIGQRQGQLTFHSVKLKMVSGQATADPPFTPAGGIPTIVSARWGIENNWEDVTLKVRKAVAHETPVIAKVEFFDSDPAYQKLKELQITYEGNGTKRTATITEGSEWTKEEYAKP